MPSVHCVSEFSCEKIWAGMAMIREFWSEGVDKVVFFEKALVHWLAVQKSTKRKINEWYHTCLSAHIETI